MEKVHTPPYLCVVTMKSKKLTLIFHQSLHSARAMYQVLYAYHMALLIIFEHWTYTHAPTCVLAVFSWLCWSSLNTGNAPKFNVYCTVQYRVQIASCTRITVTNELTTHKNERCLEYSSCAPKILHTLRHEVPAGADIRVWYWNVLVSWISCGYVSSIA